MNNLDEKIKDVFPLESVFKDPEKSKFFASLNIPSYMRDWIIKKFSYEGELNIPKIKEFIHKRIPRREDTQIIRDRLINKREIVEILAKIIVEYDISSGEALMSLPELGIPDKKHQARVEKHVIEEYGDELLSPEGAWGVVSLEWRQETPPGKKKEEGRIVCIDFKPFKPYKIDLNYFREARKNFTTNEWIDVILRSIDYNPEGFVSEKQKIWMICRLIPFVEKRVNLIELAPKGTGKTYVYSQLSKYGWLISGGSVTRAKLFYDLNRRRPGLVSRYDYVALDEVQTISFPDESEIRGALKGYLETGEYRVGDHRGIGEAGFVVLGNIPIEKQDEYSYFFDALPSVFNESALIDRFHGFIKGWELPRVKEGMKAKGYALNVEYFSEVLHRLRDEVVYRAIVDKLLLIPKSADERDVEAIKRLATGLLKLLFPHITSFSELNVDEFEKYCLKTAIEMRGIIRNQLSIMDREYARKLPEIEIKEPKEKLLVKAGMEEEDLFGGKL